MEWKTELEATCSALGTYDGTKYYKDDDCLECIKDLIRYIRRDDDNHTLRRSLGQIGVVRTDLIPILRDYHGEDELFDMCLRLMVNLTSPEILLFREEMPEDKTMRNYYLQLQSHRQMYKRSFIDEKLWAVLTDNLGKLLRKEFDERSEDDRMIIERILILVRNILQVPRDAASEKRTDGDVSIHDQVLWVLHKSGMEDLLLFIASSDDETQYCLHVLEIISLMFREQDPKNLATANFQRSKEEKVEDEMALLKIRNQEMEKKKQKFHQFTTSRHSRFGGTFTVQNVKSISERDLIYHKPLSAVNQIDFDQKKRPIKVARNRLTPGDVDVKRRSTLSIRLFLKEFCVEFLHGAYNKLMFVVKDYLNRKKAQQNDETYHLWAMKFFMEFNRIHKCRVDLVTETLSKGTFHYVHQQIEAYKDNYEHEKKNRPMCLMWARRMHLAVRAYQELLLNLVAMSKSEDAKVRESAVILRADVFYEPEYRELCLQQLSLYQPEKMSLGYLRDLVETTHVFLKIMENMAKSKHIMVSKKTKRKKKVGGKSSKKGGNSVPAGTIFLGGSREANEAKWDEVSSNLSRILQGQGDDLPTGVTPFDAASDVPIDEQKSAAMFRIQDSLKKVKPAEAIALLRASREVWPENDAFGAADADAEDEFMALREILFADIPKPSHLGDVEEDNFIEETAEIGEEEEGGDQEFEEEEEEEQYVTYSTEQEFDFRQFVMKFSAKSVCSAFGILFSNYEHNTEYTNLCIIKMFHRIAFDCSLPALLFHVSIFRTFQRVYKDFCLTPTNPSLRELCKFSKFLLRKFFEICPNNPHIFMELCFWKNAREAAEIIEGYGTQSATSKQKASYWCEEDEEKLSRVFKQLREMEQNGQGSGESGDLLDNISAFFIDSGKSRRQVAKKLKDLALIADIKEVTKKPLKMRASKDWSEDEVNQLKSLYQEFKDAVDPVNRILERMEVKRQKKRVVEKIMELGLCDDKKKLIRKKMRRGLKEGDPGYLERASETDSALEDSSEGSDSSGQEGSANSSDSEADDRTNENDGGELELVRTLKALLADEGDFKSALAWLKSSLLDEAEDRETEDCDDDEGVPVLPLTEECILAMEKEPFLKVMRMLEIAPPGNEQEKYWRIPARLSAASLKTKSAFLEKVLEGNFEVGDLNVAYLGGRPTSTSKSSSKKSKKKKEKRGPNKWMPMKRAVDEAALARIEAMFPSRPNPDSTKKSSAEKSKKSGRAKKSEDKKSGAKEKKPKARRKLKAVESDLSGNEDDDEKENQEESDLESSSNESDKSEKSDVQKKKKVSPKKKQMKSSFLESSDDESDKLVIDNDSEKGNSEVDSDATIKNSVEKSKKKKIVDSSDDDEKVVEKSKNKIVDSSDEDEKVEDSSSSKPTRSKGRLVLSSDSEAEPEVLKPETPKPEDVKKSSPAKALSQSSSPAKARSRSSSLSSRSSSRSVSPNSVLDSSRISRPSSRLSRSSRLSSSRSSSRSSNSSRSSSPRSVFATPSSRTGSLLTPASQKGGGSSVRNTPKRVRGESGSSSGPSGDDNDDVIVKSKKKITKKPKLDEKTPVKKAVAGSQKNKKTKKQKLNSSDEEETPVKSTAGSQKNKKTKKQKLNSSDEEETPVKGSGSKAKKATKSMDVSDGEKDKSDKELTDSEKDKSPVKTKSKAKRRALTSDSE